MLLKDLSYVDLWDLVRGSPARMWTPIIEHLLREDPDMLLLSSSLYDYVLPPTTTELISLIKDFGEDIVFYSVDFDQKTIRLQPAAARVFVEDSLMLNEVSDDTEHEILEDARDRACAYTGDSLEYLQDRVKRITVLWNGLQKLAVQPLGKILTKIVGFEMELSILRRDAVEEPWSTVPAKFSFGQTTVST